MPLCFKCHNATGRVPSRDGMTKLYCDNCFALYCTKLMRDGLFMYCQVASMEPMAIGVSGGPASMFMLYQLGLLRHQQRCQRKYAAHSASINELVLLPFHLNEHELLIAPMLTIAENTNEARWNERQKYLENMQEQFNMLQELASMQPSRWQGTEQRCKGSKSRVEQRIQSSEQEEQWEKKEEEWEEQQQTKVLSLFDECEVEVYKYSDFIAPDALEIIRHYIHHPKLSLSERERFYYHIRTHILCMAAHECVAKYYSKVRKEHTSPSTSQEFTTLEMQETCLNTMFTRRVHLILGEHALRAAVMAMYAIVIGKGGEGVVHGCAFRSFVHNTIFLRPVRMHLPKEIILYNKIVGVSSSFTPTLSTLTSLPSTFGVIEKYLLEISSHYRTMIFNILKMAQKLQVAPREVHELVDGLNFCCDKVNTAANNNNSNNNSNNSRRIVLCKAAEENKKKLMTTSYLPQCPCLLYNVYEYINSNNDNSTSKETCKANSSHCYKCGRCAFCGIPSILEPLAPQQYQEYQLPPPSLELCKVELPDIYTQIHDCPHSKNMETTTEHSTISNAKHLSPLQPVMLILCHACRSLLSDINNCKGVTSTSRFRGNTEAKSTLTNSTESLLQVGNLQNVQSELINLLINLSDNNNIDDDDDNYNNDKNFLASTAAKRVRGEMSADDKATYLLDD